MLGDAARVWLAAMTAVIFVGAFSALAGPDADPVPTAYEQPAVSTYEPPPPATTDAASATEDDQPEGTENDGDPVLDDLLYACWDGDLDACDELSLRAPSGSTWAEVAAACGGWVDAPVTGTCRDTADRQAGDAAETDPTTPAGGPDDLGIPGHPIAAPACDGSFALFVGSAVTPGRYADDVAAFLAANPGSNYMANSPTCTSLRSEVDGNQVYGVFFGPYPTLDIALADCYRAAAPDAFVKVLNTTTPPTEYIRCDAV